MRCADSRPRLMVRHSLRKKVLWSSDMGAAGSQVRYQPASHAHDDRYSVGANDAEQAAANRSRLSVKSAARGFKHVDALDAKQKERSMEAAREEWGIPPPAARL